MNYHDILGVSPAASSAEIKQAYRQAAKELHPDLSDSPEAAEAFARIKEAHDALIKDAAQRQESTAVLKSSAKAAAATARTAFQAARQLETEAAELARLQALDEQVRKAPKHTIFGKTKEPSDVRRHRKKLQTNERRLRGLY